MSTLSTFAKLQTCADLLRKTQYDLDRMSGRMDDEYAAFDFFVTAEHLVDWYLPNDEKAQNQLRQSETLLQVVSHIASGAKHFRATKRQHTSVEDLHRQSYGDEGYVETGYWGDVLFVDIAPSQAKVLGFQHIEAYQLALRVVSYWREKLDV